MHLDVAKRVPLNIGRTPIAWRRFEKNFVSKERMFVAEKKIKKNKIKRALQMIYFFMMIMFFFFLINHFTL
jgi:hypothetical protein